MLVVVVTVNEVVEVDGVESEVCSVLMRVSFCVVVVTPVVGFEWTDWDEVVVIRFVGELEVSTWVVVGRWEPPPPMSITSMRRTNRVRIEPRESRSPLFIE